MEVKSPRDFLAGLLFIAIGALGLWAGRNYGFGTLVRMGPGYLPMVLSAGVAIIGLIVALRALTIRGPRIESGSWRPVAMIIVAMVAFGLLIERGGIVIATAAAVILGTMATPERRYREILLAVILLPAFCGIVFVWALGQPIPVWPVW